MFGNKQNYFMTVKKTLYFGIAFLFYLTAYSQQLESARSLLNITLYGEKADFLTAKYVATIDSSKLNSVSGSNLSKMISRYLPIYAKQDAGGLSSISFRGTGASHTAIMFDGVNINSQTLGSSNSFNIPMFLFDDVKVQFGSSTSLYGSGAIGGSIHLDNAQLWNKGFGVGVEQNTASFGFYFLGGKFNYSNNKIKYYIKIYRSINKNNFSFLNTAVRDFDKDAWVKDEQKNASTEGVGILQSFSYKISEKIIFSSKQWYQDNWYQIQPNMSENYYGGDYKEIKDKSLRLINTLKYFSNEHSLVLNAIYIGDNQIYEKDYSKATSTESFIGKFNYYNTEFLYGKFNAGANYSLLRPSVYNYKKTFSEHRIDLFTSYKILLLEKLELSTTLRENIVLDYANKFTPSFGANYFIIKEKENTIKTELAISKSYRIPTFNDRYWYPNGNENLLPEDGINYEINTDWDIEKKENKYSFHISAYVMNIDNWIQWSPIKKRERYLDVWIESGTWRPNNLTKVQSFGSEFIFNSDVNIGFLNINWGVNYSYTNSSEVDDFGKLNISSRKQIYYVPKHMANIFSQFEYAGWQLQISSSYTGSRHTEDDNQLESYILFDTSIGKSIIINNNTLLLSIDISNVFDKAYQNQKYYAMPGRVFGIKVKYSYK